MKKILLLLAVVIMTAPLGSKAALAQEKEKVVTGTITRLSPKSVQILDGYISDQLYTGGRAFAGWNLKLGSLYRKHDNLHEFSGGQSSVFRIYGSDRETPELHRKIFEKILRSAYGGL